MEAPILTAIRILSLASLKSNSSVRSTLLGRALGGLLAGAVGLGVPIVLAQVGLARDSGTVIFSFAYAIAQFIDLIF